MERKLLQKLIAFVLVLCLTATNFIFVATSTVHAITANAELEGGNIVFKAYFKDGDSQITSKTANISEGTTLYLSLDLKAGKLTNGKINIENANFNIGDVDSKYAKVNSKDKEIVLSDIDYTDTANGAIEIALPLTFEEEEKIPTSYFSMENSITLSGKYTNSSTKTISSDPIKTTLTWDESFGGKNVLHYDSPVEKIIYLEDATLVQVSASSTYVDKYLPKETETVSINVPKVNNVTPTYTVLVNGEKVDNEDIVAPVNSGEISYTKNFVKDGKIEWNKSGDTYKIIYLYEGITRLEEPLRFTAKFQNKLLNRDMGDVKTTNAESNVPKGNIATVTAQTLSSDVYKGYMYANSDETAYEERYDLELSSVKDLTPTLEFDQDKFETENSKISTNNKTVYKNISISKDSLRKVLGANGKIIVALDNEQTKTITANSSDTDGIVVVDTQDSHSLKLSVKNAENEGTLRIFATKAIQGNAGYGRETLATIKSIETTVKSYVAEDETPSQAEVKTELKETVTEATLEMNNNNVLSTINKNNIEFVATIKTGTIDTDLIKEPSIKIILPEEVESVELTSAPSALYVGEELTVASSEVIEENGTKAIVVKLAGEQFEYDNKLMESIKITVYADITLNKLAASRENAEISMEYTNENSTDQKYTATTKVMIQAPFGLITEAKVNDNFETTSKGVESLLAKITNNYGKAIEDISLIGVNPGVKESKEEFEKNIKDELKSTLNVENIEIKYSQDGESFGDNFENAKNYKIVFKDSELAPGANISILHRLDVNKISGQYKLAYIYEGNERVEDLRIDQNASSTSETPQEQPRQQIQQPERTRVTVVGQEKITLGMAATTQTGDVTDETKLLQNQVVRYIYQVKNNSTENVDNVNLSVKHQNANIFEDQTEQQVNTMKPDEMLDFTFEVETDKSEKEFAIGTLKPGETKIVTYQVRIKEDATTLKTTVELSAKDQETITEQKENEVQASPVKLEITNNVAKEYPIQAGKIFANIFKITNTSDEALENIVVNFSIPQEYEYYEMYEALESNNYRILQSGKNYLSFSINRLAGKTSKELNIALRLIEKQPSVETSKFNYTVRIGENEYSSNDTEVAIKEYVETKLEVKMTSNLGEIVKTGDKLIYRTQIKNVGNNDDTITFLDFVPEAAQIKKAYYVKGNDQTNIENTTDNKIYEGITLKAGEEVNVYIETEIDEELTGREEISNNATITANFLEEPIHTETITNKLQANIKANEDGKQDSSEENENKDSNSDIDSDVEYKQSISGLAWIDANKNGARDISEKPLAGITVALANVETAGYVTNSNGTRLEVQTDEDGVYKFENIASGKYIVVFMYDNIKYRNTEYKANGVAENMNSDIITSKISKNDENVKYGITDTLKLGDESLENIDAGFIENEVFDLSLNKYITKVTVQNSSGTTVQQYNKEKLAKLEINSKVLAGSTVIVEYTMEIKNEGELAGYANEIVDYLPKDLTFSSEMNKDWYVSTDGNLHTTSLSKVLINPGETKTITLALVKTMTENNTGLTTNKAEIAKSSNELSIPDRDSKAGNGKQGEDDMSTAEVIISINTGMAFTIGIIVSILVLTGTAIAVIYTKRRKEANNHE